MTIELRDISLSFDEKSFLFRNLTMQFNGPRIYAFLGPSGCGKSTLIRLLAGLQKTTTGEVLKNPHLKQAFIFQESHLLNWRSAFENVALPLELQNKNSEELVLKALKDVDLDSALNLFPSELSGGMKMRVSLARAFVTHPQILFCDEPFAALDEVTREKLQEKLRQKVAENQTLCFFVTHNLSEALSVADEIYSFSARGKLDPKPFMVNRSLNQLSELRQKVRGQF